MDLIQAVSVCRDFDTPNGVLHILKNIDLSLPEHTLSVLKGRSGSGKTTLMNILGTLDQPTSGSVIINGVNVTNFSEEERDQLRRNYISFVFQSVALIQSMTAYENVEFMLRIAQKPLDKERILHCLDAVGLSNRVHHMPYQLSGGEQQRVAIARAIVHSPKIVFADEPTAQLDSVTSEKMMRMFHELIRREQITVVMTTHDQNMMELADRVFTMDDGKIVDNENEGVD